MRKIISLAIAAAASAGSLVWVAPAEAAVTVDGYTLDTGSFGTGYGVHSNGTQSGNTIYGTVNQDGSAVTFSSTDGLQMTGGGEATVYSLGKISDGLSSLEVDFAKAWDSITFAFAADGDGTFDLLVNSTSLFNGNSSPSQCNICTISASGENKFTLSGSGITNLGFTFVPGVNDAKQFRVESVSAVPEPATWAIMLFGFVFIGGAIRSAKRRQMFSASYA